MLKKQKKRELSSEGVSANSGGAEDWESCPNSPPLGKITQLKLDVYHGGESPV